MATRQNRGDAVPQEPPFRLFAVEQRVLAQNAAGKVIDIGAMESTDGQFSARLETEEVANERVEPKRSVELALKALADELTVESLDALFAHASEVEVNGRLQDYPGIEFEADAG